MNAVSTSGQYGLRWNPRPSLLPQYAILAVLLTLVSAWASYRAVLTAPDLVRPISNFYFASVFYALFTYWFGGWGLLATFAGSAFAIYHTSIGSASHPLLLAVIVSIGNVVEPLIPFLALRTQGARIGIHPLGINLLRRPKFIVLFFFVGALLPPLVSGLVGITALAVAGTIPQGAYWRSLGGWWLGACILLTVAVPLFGTLFGRWLDRRHYACLGIWS